MIIDSGIVTGSLQVIGNTEVTGSLKVTAGITGSLNGNADTATSASYADQANSAINALTASYLSGYVSPFPFTGSAIVSGSLIITGSTASSEGFIGALQGNADTSTSSSYATNASNSVTAISASSIPYSGLTGTVPTWNQDTTGNASTATSASYAANATSASYALNSTNATNVSNASTVSSITGNTGLLRDRLAASSQIDSLTSSNFRTTLFGSSTGGYQISTARWGSVPTLLSGRVGAYGTMVAWAGSDTQGFLAVDYNSAAAAIGGGNSDLINWTKNLAFADGTGGVSGTWGIGITGNAGTATTLQTARTINGVSFNGSANISVSRLYDSGGSGNYISFSSGNEFETYDSAGSLMNMYLNYSGGASSLLGPSGNIILHAGNYNNYAPTLTGTGASGTWGISVTGTAGGVSWGNVSSKPSYIMYYQGFTLDANTMDTNSTGFTYANNAPWTGPIVKFSTGGGYDLQLNSNYGNGQGISYRTRNGDGGTNNPWYRLYSDSYRPYADEAGYAGYSTSVELTGGNYIWFNGSGYHNVRMSESYGIVMNMISHPWHVQVVNGSFMVGTTAAGGNYGIGNGYFTGDVTAYYSDKRLKHNLNLIDKAVDKVKLLNGYTYQHNELGQELLKENPHKIHAGLIAQEVQAVLPEVVTIAPFDLDGYDEHGNGVSRSGENYLTIKYERIVPLLVEAIKEQQTQIDELKELVNKLINK